MALTKFTSGTALAKPNTSALTTKSKQVHVLPYSLARSHIYLAKRKNVTAPFANGKRLLPVASKKVTTS